MFIKAPSKRDRHLSILLAIIILIIGFFLLRPNIKNIQSLQNQKFTLENENIILEKRLANLKELGKNFEAIKDREEIKKLPLLLPKGPDIPNLLINLESLAQAKGLILSSVDIEPTRTWREELESTEIRVEFSGKIDYQLFKTLLQTLENNLRLFEVLNFSFKPLQSSLLLHLRIFSLKI